MRDSKDDLEGRRAVQCARHSSPDGTTMVFILRFSAKVKEVLGTPSPLKAIDYSEGRDHAPWVIVISCQRLQQGCMILIAYCSLGTTLDDHVWSNHTLSLLHHIPQS